jgi:hypothetical protein
VKIRGGPAAVTPTFFSDYKKETFLATVCHCFEPSEWEGSQRSGEARRPAEEHKNGTDGKGNPIGCFKKHPIGFFYGHCIQFN